MNIINAENSRRYLVFSQLYPQHMLTHKCTCTYTSMHTNHKHEYPYTYKNFMSSNCSRGGMKFHDPHSVLPQMWSNSPLCPSNSAYNQEKATQTLIVRFHDICIQGALIQLSNSSDQASHSSSHSVPLCSIAPSHISSER